MFGFLKGLKFVKIGSSGSTVIKGAGSTVGSSAAKAAGTAASAFAKGAGGFGSAVRGLPLFRIFAGSAVGIVIIDAWNSLTSKICEFTGMDSDSASVLLGIGILLLIAAAVSSVSKKRGRRH